ncbi:MAG: tyrosine-type recombinase/integrase [Candidatus Bathyarchaeia archaeon]
MKEEDFLQSLGRNTRKSYRTGLRKFEQYFGKSVDEILKLREQDLGSDDIHRKRRFEKEMEKFHQSLLDKGYAVNTARTMTLGIIQIFRFYDMPIKKRYGSKISRTVISTRDHMLTIFDIRKMNKVGDLRARTLLCMSKDLGWRISDFLSILKTEVEPLLKKEPPASLRKLTRKERVPAYSFLSDESLQHLKTYLPTLNPNNKWLWEGKRRNSHLDAESVNDLLKKLAKDARLELTGSLHFHAFRKLFMTTGVELGCNHWAIKMLVGKAVTSSDLTYISQARLSETFLKISDVLRINEPKTNAKIPALEQALTSLEKENMLLKTRIDNLQSNTMNLEERLDKIGDFMASTVEFGNYTEEEKEAVRRKFNLREFTEEEKQQMDDLKEIVTVLQGEKGYMDEKDNEELKRRFAAKLKKRQMAKERDDKA